MRELTLEINLRLKFSDAYNDLCFRKSCNFFCHVELSKTVEAIKFVAIPFQLSFKLNGCRDGFVITAESEKLGQILWEQKHSDERAIYVRP